MYSPCGLRPTITGAMGIPNNIHNRYDSLLVFLGIKDFKQPSSKSNSKVQCSIVHSCFAHQSPNPSPHPSHALPAGLTRLPQDEAPHNITSPRHEGYVQSLALVTRVSTVVPCRSDNSSCMLPDPIPTQPAHHTKHTKHVFRRREVGGGQKGSKNKMNSSHARHSYRLAGGKNWRQT